MPIRRHLIGVADSEQCRLIERFGAKLDAERERGRASGEAARQHDGGNPGHIGDVKGVGARR